MSTVSAPGELGHLPVASRRELAQVGDRSCEFPSARARCATMGNCEAEIVDPQGALLAKALAVYKVG